MKKFLLDFTNSQYIYRTNKEKKEPLFRTKQGRELLIGKNLFSNLNSLWDFLITKNICIHYRCYLVRPENPFLNICIKWSVPFPWKKN